jgi:hypothetical protein
VAQKTGGLNSPHVSTKIGKVPAVAGNTFVTDVAITQPSAMKKSGTSTSFPKK